MGWGQRIREAREKAGLSQSGLAEGVGSSQQTIGGYEQEKSEPTIEMFLRIADYLAVNVVWLVFSTVMAGPRLR